MVIPNYNIIEKIAENPQATIYKAYHKANPRQLLVIKILKANFLSPYKNPRSHRKLNISGF